MKIKRIYGGLKLTSHEEPSFFKTNNPWIPERGRKRVFTISIYDREKGLWSSIEARRKMARVRRDAKGNRYFPRPTVAVCRVLMRLESFSIFAQESSHFMVTIFFLAAFRFSSNCDEIDWHLLNVVFSFLGQWRWSSFSLNHPLLRLWSYSLFRISGVDEIKELLLIL